MRFTVRTSIVILGVWLAITVYSVYLVQSLKFSYNIEAFFDESDPELKAYNEFRNRFENDNDFLLIGIKNNSGLFDSNFLSRIRKLSQELEKLPQVIYVRSPLTLKQYSKAGGIINESNLLSAESPETFSEDSVRIFGAEFWRESFFGKGRHSVLVFVKKKEKTTRTENEQLYASLTKFIKDGHFDESHVAGRVRTQHYYVAQMFNEMPLLGMLSLALVLIVILILLRWWWTVLLVPIIMISSVAGALALIAITGESLNLIMILLPVFIIVTGMSAGIHLISRYLSLYSPAEDRSDTITKVFRELGYVNFSATFTTAAGFASLYFLPVGPVSTFGIYTAAGVLYTFFISSVTVPAILRLLPPPRKKIENSTRERSSKWIWNMIFNHPKKVFWLSTSICIILFIPAYYIRTNTQFLDDVNAKSDLRADLEFFEREFSGIRPLEISVRVKQPGMTVFSLPVLQQLDTLEHFLRNEFKAGFILSPVTLIKTARKIQYNGNEKGYTLPKTDASAEDLAAGVTAYTDSSLLRSLITKDGQTARISAKMPDLGSAVMRSKRELFSTFTSKYLQSNLIEVKITGAAPLMDKAGDSIALNMVKGLGLSALLYVIVAALIARSLKVAILSLLPNLLVLFVCAGLMGMAGIELKAFTSIVFAIIFGIAVDDTLHLVARVKTEIDTGKEGNEAVKQAWEKLYSPMIHTSLMLSAGFLVLCFSSFPSSKAMGLLLSASLLTAMILDLLLTPVILRFTYQKKAPKI